MHQAVILAVLFCLLISTAPAWESRDELYARAAGDGNMTLATDLNKSVSSDGSEKAFLATLLATGVKDISFTSSNYLTRVDENGELNTTGSEMSEELSLPEEFNVFMLHNQSTSAAGVLPETGSSTLSLYDPDSPEEEIFARQASFDLDDLDVDDIINETLRETLGEGVTMERISNMGQDLTMRHKYHSTLNGETCSWGESKNMAIKLI